MGKWVEKWDGEGESKEVGMGDVKGKEIGCIGL